jgi:hypothetical protein
MEGRMNASGYDPELPFLAELEHRVRAYAEYLDRPMPSLDRQMPLARPAPLRQPRSRATRAVAARVSRRVAVLATLVCLLGASAFGARAVFFQSSPNLLAVHQSAFVAVAHGRDGDDQWTMRLYTRDGELCRELTVLPQEASSGCAPAPAPYAMASGGAISILHRFLFGVTGTDVRTVLVSVGDSHLALQTHPLDRAQARTLGVADSTRFFVGALGRPLGYPDPPAFLSGLDADGRRVGDVHMQCAQEAAPSECGT